MGINKNKTTSHTERGESTDGPTKRYSGADGVEGSQEESKASNNEQGLEPAEKRWSLWAPETAMSWATSALQYTWIIKQTTETSKLRSASTSEPSTLLVHQRPPRLCSVGADALGMLQPSPPTPLPALALPGTAQIQDWFFIKAAPATEPFCFLDHHSKPHQICLDYPVPTRYLRRKKGKKPLPGPDLLSSAILSK